MSNRRAFLKKATAATAFLAGQGLVTLNAGDLLTTPAKVSLRFAVASDGHYGQPDTSFSKFFSSITGSINDFHSLLPLKACVINGDIIHDQPEFLAPAKAALDALKMDYYVTRGNHDMVTSDLWEETWQQPLNQVIDHGKHSFILCDTSNEQGAYLCPDLVWLAKELDKRKEQQNIFLFLHIPQVKWTQFSIESPSFIDLAGRYANISAIFHGHEHGEDGQKMMGTIPCFFDGHVGGNWGTEYRGFRVVEVYQDKGFVTWIMNPDVKINEFTHGR